MTSPIRRNDIVIDLLNVAITPDENGFFLYLSDFVSSSGIYTVRARGFVGFNESEPPDGQWYIAIEEHTDEDGAAGLTVLNSYVVNDPPTDIPLTGSKFRIQAAYNAEAPGFTATLSAIVRALPV
jgi:hypothetical protein